MGLFQGEDCAVKFLTYQSEEAREGFLREIKLLGTLHSDHIRKCLGWSVSGKSLVLLMESMPGTFLTTAIP